MDKNKALNLALEVLDWMYMPGFTQDDSPINNAITALREALAQPQQEPVGEVCGYYERGFDAEKTRYGKLYNQELPLGIKLYITPPAAQRQWVELTDDEISEIAMQSGAYDEQLLAFARAIEAKLKEKNT